MSDAMTRFKESLLDYFTLFSSMGTLICCALPALLVSLGLGAVMAGLASEMPGLVWVSEHKPEVFGLAGLMLLVNGALIWSNRNAPCPTDLKLRDACRRGRKTSLIIYFLSLATFLTGTFFSFIAPVVFS